MQRTSERSFARSDVAARPKLGPQTMVRAGTLTPVSGRPPDFEQAQIAGTLGARLRELRRERKLSLRDVERRSGVARSTLSRLEHGLRRPRASTLGWIAYALGPDTTETTKRELCAAAGPSLITESRWSERSHARRAWQALCAGEMPLPAWLAAPYSTAIFGAVFPDRLAMLRQAEAAASQGMLPWPAGAQGSTEILALSGELLDARPHELARIGRALAAAETGQLARARRRVVRERRAALGLTGVTAPRPRNVRIPRGVPPAERELVRGALLLARHR